LTAAGALYSRVEQFRRRGPFLIATDFDGTLTPIAPSPDAAVLPPEAADVLRSLCATPGCTLMIVSGRSLEDLRSRVRVPAVLAGNHGLEMEGPGLAYRHAAAVAMMPRLKEACSRIHDALQRWPGAFVEAKGLTATVHYRLVAEERQPEVRRAVRRCMAVEGTAFGLRAGKRALEIHPRIDWDKGAAVNWVCERLGLDHERCVCIGDDRTDESMFRRCSRAVTVAVGHPRGTAAEFLLHDPGEVRELLYRVANPFARA
jgi:trehalose 6-phosphate phosphatase